MKTELNATGHAALAICESLLLALSDRQVLDEHEVIGILKDAASAHRNAIPLTRGDDSGTHEAAALLIEAIIAGGNSVRHPESGKPSDALTD